MTASTEVSDENLVDLVMKTAGLYPVFVDALKLGNYGKTEFSVDCNSKTLTIYEGGNMSGHDAAIVQRDYVTVPFHRQSPLVDDADQLTARWSAGEYRRLLRVAGIACPGSGNRDDCRSATSRCPSRRS